MEGGNCPTPCKKGGELPGRENVREGCAEGNMSGEMSGSLGSNPQTYTSTFRRAEVLGSHNTKCLLKRWSQTIGGQTKSPGGYRQLSDDHTRSLPAGRRRTGSHFVNTTNAEAPALRPLDDGRAINLRLAYTLHPTNSGQLSGDDCTYTSDCRERPSTCSTHERLAVACILHPYPPDARRCIMCI